VPVAVAKAAPDQAPNDGTPPANAMAGPEKSAPAAPAKAADKQKS
jgi:hypothetical protein